MVVRLDEAPHSHGMGWTGVHRASTRERMNSTPEEAADLLMIGVLEQMQSRTAELGAMLAEVAPLGSAPVNEDIMRAEAISAGLAMCILHLEKRLSPEDLHRLYLRAGANAEDLIPEFSRCLWVYYLITREAAVPGRLRVLSQLFRARCCDLDETQREAPPDCERLASLLVPKGSAEFAVEVGRALREPSLGGWSE